MKNNLLIVGFLLVLAIGACKKDNPAPAQQNVDLLAHKWNWVQTTMQDYPDVGQPLPAETTPAPATSYWEFKSNGDLDFSTGGGSGIYTTHWAKMDDKNFLMPFSSICVISVLDAHNLTFSRTESYNDGITQYTEVFTR